MPAAQGAKVVWADITYVINRINNARTKHGLSSFSLTATVKPEAATVNTLITRLKEANNAIVSSTITINIANVTAGTLMQASKLTEIYNIATQVYNHCTCNAQCSCNCNYCPCNCDYCSCLGACYCPCNCDYCSCLGACYCSCDCANCPQCPACPNCGCNCYNCPQCPQCPDSSCGCLGN